MPTILKETSSTLTMTYYVNGTATDVGDVTIHITDANGDDVVAAATATTNNADGTYDYAVANTLTAEVATWEAKWTDSDTGNDVRQAVEVIGGHLFTEAEARAFDGSAMANTTNYTDNDIAAARDRITDTFEQICGVSFVPRYYREVIAGTATRDLVTRKVKVAAVISATIGTTAQTASDIDVIGANDDVLWHTTNHWTAPTSANPTNITVEYRHGLAAVPHDITRAALMVLRHELVDSNVSDRALSLTNEFGNVRLATPGVFGAYYGLPHVDEALRRHSYRSFV